ncbi:MAG: hypothetical protein AMXMBFR53_08230 [Gemmatimonadota bacterium]
MTVRRLAHAAGGVGALLVVLLLVGVMVTPADTFPDSKLRAFHTFFVGTLVEQEGLPEENDPDWLATAEPGDVLFLSRGHVAWGEWSHVAMVVRAPDDALWVEPGSLAVLDASIHDGFYLTPIETYTAWPRVVVRRASRDPDVRRRMAEAALTHRTRMFVGVARGRAPYSNCTTSVISALASVGIDAGVKGWRTPDELLRSPVWLD